MKFNTPTKVIISTAGFCLILLTTIKAQELKCVETEASVQSKTANQLSVITENDYPNLMTLSGLKKYSNIQYDVKVNEKNEHRLDGIGKYSSLYAVYGKNGNLVKAEYITKNSRLPANIYKQLVEDNFKDWTMTGNKKIVLNFDPMRTEYEVTLKKDKMKQTLYFDNAGNRITRLAHKG